MNPFTATPLTRPLSAHVRVPGSKSLTNRAFAAAALAGGETMLAGVLFADDTERMAAALQSLGFGVVLDRAARSARVTGRGGQIPAGDADLDCAAAGTVMRFCTALCALGQGRYRLDGTQRMRERPVGELVDALRQLGTLVEFERAEGTPPVIVHARGLRGGTVSITSPPSSQMVSALLLAGPAARGDVLIDVAGELVSRPYIDMTIAVMAAFGVSVVDDGAGRFIVPAPQSYKSCTYAIEPDASNATYFLAAPAIAGGTVTVDGLGTASVQGDARFVDVLERMGCAIERSADRLTVHGPATGQPLRGVDVDLNKMPDTAQTLAAVALYADGPTRIRNVANLRLKETDRLEALATELRRVGATIEMFDDGLEITPPEKVQPANISTYDDHRMAMSFALLTLRTDGIVIHDPACVGKTFPDFFDVFRAMCSA